MGDRVLRVIRIVTPAITFVATLLITAFMAGLYTLVFAFVLGLFFVVPGLAILIGRLLKT